MRASLVMVLLALLVGQALARPLVPPPVRDPLASPRVAIVVEIAIGVDPARASEISGTLAAAITSQLMVEARGGTAVTERLPAGGLTDGCLARPACVTDVGRRLEVDQLLFIALVQLGDQLQLDTSWTDADGTHNASRPRILLGPGDVAEEVFRARAVTLLPEARLRADVSVRVPVTGPGRPRRHLTGASKSLAALAVVGFGAGVGLGLSTRSAFLACEGGGCDGDRRDSIRLRGRLADASFAAAALSALAGTILYLRSAPAEPRVRVEVAARATGVSLVVGGRF